MMTRTVLKNYKVGGVKNFQKSIIPFENRNSNRELTLREYKLKKYICLKIMHKRKQKHRFYLNFWKRVYTG